ncbi:bZIP transcription factor 27-like [Vigna radiata var. radiata]|uniref:BZIP transcription factor 27-like n=1 Tax=Vigna radiata var. radiata TaxID=3916 RepID=A0A1S3U3Q7_VIGRR|nr:bZIP transcription factor 27-like [Vigna radiata var. radiata]
MASASACNCCRRKHVSNSPSPPPTPTSSLPQILLPPSSSSYSSTRIITLHQFLPLHSSSLSETEQILKSKACTSHSAHSDERFKRLIKSRDCAARSRAKQQAYQNQLETKLALLIQENSTLRSQIEEMKIRLKCGGAPKKHSLYRTSTSPF